MLVGILMFLQLHLSDTDLGSEDSLASLRDHVELLDSRGQIACCSQVGQTHKAALSPDVIVGPVVPLVWSMGAWRYKY